MIGLLWSILAILISPCRSNARLEAENAVLRHQLLVLRRKCRGRVRLTNFDRWIFVQLYRLFPSVLQVLHVIRPETLVRWHRAGFHSYWRWNVSAQSHTRDRGDGPFRRADACLQLALWLHHRSARPPRARLDWRDGPA